MADNQQRPNPMHAVVLTKVCETKDFQLSTRFERPVLHEDEVLIEVHAFGLNYADILMRKGLYPDAPST